MMMIRPALSGLMLGLCLLGIPFLDAVRADTGAVQTMDPSLAARLATLSDTMQVGPIIDVMHDEGLAYGATMAEDMFAAAPDARWAQVVAGIYDTQAMKDTFNTHFAAALAQNPAGLVAIEDFFGSERGQRILQLEVTARRALLDTAVEDAAKVAAEDMAVDHDPRLALLKDFVAAGDLIEMNVTGAMNTNLAFYEGMAETGSFGKEMTEDQILTDVWDQEPKVRADTEAWLIPYLAMAYQPLSDADLEAYTAFWESAAGHQLNAALFASFDVMFTDISRNLGRAAAKQMQGDDI
jgi:hypothetical protein